MSLKISLWAFRRSVYFAWTMRVMTVLTIWFVGHCVLISMDGFDDVYSANDPVDAAVVLGNEVLPNGTPSDVLTKRLQKGLEAFKSGAARHIICSGGKGPKELWEAQVMSEWLIARGVEPTKIVIDNGGKDSYCTARDTKRIFEERGWKSALIVSHFTHITRCKIAFRRFGIEHSKTAHADFAWGDFKGFPHEFVGYYYYWLRRD